MKSFRKIMYVVDPTTAKQKALGRVVDGAHHLGASLHLYACVPAPNLRAEDPEALKQAEIARYQLWLDLLAKPARDVGVDISTEVEISNDWRSAIAAAGQRWGAEMIVKAMHQHSAMERRLQKTADWTLLRTTDCPILFIKEDSPSTPKHLVAAVDLQEKSEQHRQLMRDVIHHSRGICETTGAELHVTNACPNVENMVDSSDVARFAEVERRQVHIGQGAPEEVLMRVANALEGPVVVIGSSERRGLGGKVMGNTAERILDRMPMDVLVIVAPREERRQAA